MIWLIFPRCLKQIQVLIQKERPNFERPVVATPQVVLLDLALAVTKSEPRLRGKAFCRFGCQWFHSENTTNNTQNGLASSALNMVFQRFCSLSCKAICKACFAFRDRMVAFRYHSVDGLHRNSIFSLAKRPLILHGCFLFSNK